MKKRKETMLYLKDCIRLRKLAESTYGINLMDRGRKDNLVSQRAAFIAAMMNELKPTAVALAESMEFATHAVVLHHKNNHRNNFVDIDTDFSKYYRYWYNLFSELIISEREESRFKERVLAGEI